MCFAAVFGMTCVYMAMMMRATLSDFNKIPTRSYADSMRPYKPPAPHPEMEGVKTGEELLVYTPEEDEEDDDDGDIPTYR